MVDTKVTIGKLKLKNPVLVASGTFGYGEEFKDFINLKKLGAIVTKTITLSPRKGNPPPRTCETPAGLINSIGLENPGIEEFIKQKMPALRKIAIPVIVSIASEAGKQEFVELAGRLDKVKGVSAIELNISCPNIRSQKREVRGQGLISQDAEATYEVVKSVRKKTKRVLITKLSPNVTDITEIARAAEQAGSDALSLVNTFNAMSIDAKTRMPKIALVSGGLSGPCIRPIAVKMVWDVFRRVKIPIIGMGGIMDTQSALEFIIAGATAIAAGTANFINPKISIEIIDGLKKYFAKNRIKNINSLIGSLKI